MLTLVTYEEWVPAIRRALAVEHPDWTIRIASAPGDPGWADGDVVWWGAPDPTDEPPRGRLALDALAAATGFDLGPFGRFLDLERVLGPLYALPVSYAGWVLCYNADLLARATLAPPDADVTWDGLLELVDALQRSGVAIPFGHGAYGWMVAVLAWQGGADPDDPGSLYPAVEHVRRLRGLAGVPDAAAWPFTDGHAALEINDSAVVTLHAGASLRWGAVPLPRVDPLLPRRNAWRRSHVYLRATCRVPQAAFALAAFVATHAPGLGTGEFAVYGGHGDHRQAAEQADREEWSRASPFLDRALWAGLQRALEEGLDREALVARIATVIAEAPT